MKFWYKCFLFALSAPCIANDNYDFSGFGSTGYISSSSEEFGYRNDLSYSEGIFKDDFDLKVSTVLGVQFDYAATNEFDFAIQGVYRGQKDFDFDKAISQAFVRYSPSVKWSARIGRMPISLFRYTEYRDIGFALTFAKVPNEIYGIVPYRYLDGADLTYLNQFKSHTLRAKIFYGTSSTDVGFNNIVEEVGVEQAYGVNIQLETVSWLFESSYSVITIENNSSSIDQLIQGVNFIGATAPTAWPDSNEFASQLSLVGKKGSYKSVSAQYNGDNWRVESELTWIRGDGILIRPVDSHFTAFTYRFEDWSLFTSFAESNADRYAFEQPFIPSDVYTDPQAIALAQLVFSNISLSGNFYASNQQTWSIGARWNINEQLALKLQFDRTMIDEGGGTLWLQEQHQIAAPEDVNTLHLNMSFIF